MPEETQEKMDWNRIFLNPVIPKLWSNGVAIGRSSSEATVLFLQGQAAIVTVSMGYPALKSLYNAIGKVLADVERITGQSIKDNHELSELFTEKKLNDANDNK